MKSLFRSQTSFELVHLFTGEPEKRFFLAEIVKLLQKDPANLLRELGKLQESGFILLTIDSDKKYYALNTKHHLTDELQALFAKMRSVDERDQFGNDWILAEEVPNICPFFSRIWLNTFVRQFASPIGRPYKKIAAIYRNYHLWFYYDKQDAYAMGEHVVDRLIADPAFMDEVNVKIVELSDELRAFSESILEYGLDALSNKELFALYTRHDEIHTRYYQWAWIPVAADMFGDNLTERGKTILRNHGVGEDDINTVLTTLNQPTKPSLIQEEQDALATIGILVQADPEQYALIRELFRKFKEEDVKLFKLYEHSPQYEAKFEEAVRDLVNKIRPDILQELHRHYAKYFYTKFLFTEEQGVYSFEHFLKLLVRLVNHDSNLESTRDREHEENLELGKRQKALMKQIGLSKSEQQIFFAWGDFMVTKIYRRYAQIFALYRMTPIVEEIGKRIGASLKETRFMMNEEIERALFDGVVSIDEVRDRVQLSVYVADANDSQYLTGKKAEDAVKLIQKEKFAMVDELKGQCGCQGSARGTVRVVNVIEEMSKIQPGDILVSICTQPDLVPAMKKAAAFITDQGGVTSHAAIVAREMQKPCVIGTKIATKVLHDGDVVEVDATRGTVKVISRMMS